MASSRPEATAEEADLSFARTGYPPKILRHLRRGHWRVEDSLDLHGMNRIEAERAVGEFVGRSHQRGLSCVCIVHGRGWGSRDREPVLKGKLRGWLTTREEVLAFSPAPAAHGGAGAVLVLLRS